MSDDNHVHPGAERLSAFGLGQLDPPETAEVERHVQSCMVCCQTLWSLPDDKLVSLLQQAFRKPPELAEHPRYRIVEMLGQGGMGTVYKAEHRFMERLVALKVIDRSLTGNPAAVERFRREVKAAAQLNHPNIVHAYDAEQAGDSHFLVMEFVEGTTLARLVEQQGTLPVAEACDYVRQAALGLQRAFEHGMVHRDIKPHNLMRTPQGAVKILDFGLARLSLTPARSVSEGSPRLRFGLVSDSASLTQLGMVMGTADYMAPEQADDAHNADIRADIYSLGCTLYYLLAGQAPFPEGTVLDKLRAHKSHKPRPLSDFRKDVPAALVRVLERMTAKEPAQRYQTPAEAAEALRPFLAAPRRSRRLWYTAAALLLTAALTAAIIFIRTDDGELILETNDPNIAVQIDKAGVKVIDRSSKREYHLKRGKHRLAKGEYDIDVSELPDGVELSTPKFQLRRGDKVTVIAHARGLQEKAMKFPRSFGVGDKLITQDGVSVEKDGWRIVAKGTRTVRLFEIANPDAEQCRVIYQAQLKCENLQGKAYLEMLCHFPGKGEFFSKDLPHALSGTTDYAHYETPFFLKKGERPDRIKLNVVIEGTGAVWIKDAGAVWIKDVSLRKAPLPSGES